MRMATIPKKAEQKTLASLPVIDGMRVDLAALRSLAHECDPLICRKSGSCCACYEVAITGRELNRMIGMLPLAAEHAPALEDADLYEEGDGGACVLETDEAGRCVFAYKDKRRRVLCSVHAAASERGLDPYAIKPLSCSLWPLAISEDKPPVLGIQDDALDFPCNRRRRGKGLDPGVAQTLEACFGAAFLENVSARLTQL